MRKVTDTEERADIYPPLLEIKRETMIEREGNKGRPAGRGVMIYSGAEM
jgi:hypothetical protein